MSTSCTASVVIIAMEPHYFDLYSEVWVEEERMSEPYVYPSAVTVYEV